MIGGEKYSGNIKIVWFFIKFRAVSCAKSINFRKQ